MVFLNVCVSLEKPARIRPCSPPSNKCPSYTGSDYHYVESIACTLNREIAVQIANSCYSLIPSFHLALPLNSQEFLIRRNIDVSYPVDPINITFLYNKEKLLDSSFWFLNPFSRSLWLMYLITVVVVLPAATVLLDKTKMDRNIGSTWMQYMFNYGVAYLNQFVGPCNGNRLIRSCWLLSLIVTLSYYSCNLISFIASKNIDNRFENDDAVMNELIAGDHKLAYAIPSIQAAALLGDATENDIIEFVVSLFPLRNNFSAGIKSKMLHSNGHINEEFYSWFVYPEDNIQQSFESFFPDNKNTFLMIEGSILNQIINCGNIFQVYNMESDLENALLLGGLLDPRTKSQLNNAIASTYDSDLYRVLVQKDIGANDVTRMKHCSKWLQPITFKLKWPNVYGLVFICFSFVCLATIVFATEIVGKVVITLFYYKKFRFTENQRELFREKYKSTEQ